MAFTAGSVLAMKGGNKEFIKIGKAKIKLAVPGADTTQTIGASKSISLAGTKGTFVSTLNLIFQENADLIAEGQEFEVAGGADRPDGKVNIEFTVNKVARSGKSTLVASDTDTNITGTVKIISVTDTSFTATLSAKATNALKRVSNPLKGDLEGTDSRQNNVKILAKFTGAL